MVRQLKKKNPAGISLIYPLPAERAPRGNAAPGEGGARARPARFGFPHDLSGQPQGKSAKHADGEDLRLPGASGLCRGASGSTDDCHPFRLQLTSPLRNRTVFSPLAPRAGSQTLCTDPRCNTYSLRIAVICSTSLKRHFFPLKSYFPKHLPQDRAQN